MAENEFGNLPARWDVGWYLGIAVDGYSFSDAAKAAGNQQDIVFFPAMPLLMRVTGRLLGGAVDRLRLGRHGRRAARVSRRPHLPLIVWPATCWETSSRPRLRCG